MKQRTTKAKKPRPSKAQALPPGLLGFIPDAPSWLDGEAPAIFRQAAADLVSRGLLRAATVDVLAQYAAAAALAQKALASIQADGLTYVDKNQQERKNPVFTMWRSATETAAKLAKELCLTPYSATRTPGIDEGPPDNTRAGVYAEIRRKHPALAAQVIAGLEDPLSLLRSPGDNKARQIADAYRPRLAQN